MSVKKIMVLNTRLIDIESGENVCKINESGGQTQITSDGTARTISGWLSYIGTDRHYIIGVEFVLIHFATTPLGIAFDNEELATAIGYEKDEYFEPDIYGNFYGNSWGSFRLFLQGSESEDSSGRVWTSRMLAPERVNGKVNNESWESVNYVVNSYDKRFDMKRWKIPCHWLGTEKEQWVRDFLDACGSGRDSDEVVVYGDGHWINESETWKVLGDQYNGIEVDLGHALLVKFMIGLRQVTT